MDSNTPIFRVNLEYDDTKPTNARDEYQQNENGELVMNGVYVCKNEAYQNYLRNIDFGIVERAKQALKLDKEVKNIKITLANGSILVDAEVIIGPDGIRRFKDPVKDGVYLPDSTQNGSIKFELDNEIIQGARIEIEYTLRVTNISEIDYLNKEYYWYGRGKYDKDIVRLNTEQIVDYLDNNIALDTTNDQIGKIIDQDQKEATLIGKKLLEDNDDMRRLLKEYQKVMIIDGFKADQLTPIDITVDGTEIKTQTEKTFTVNKLLSTISRDDEISFDNDAEIIQTLKTGGASLTTIHGNHIPNASMSRDEEDDDLAETVLITPPTGSNKNYMTYAILSISSLGILTCGIVLIKKFVLK